MQKQIKGWKFYDSFDTELNKLDGAKRVGGYCVKI
jgi:hypothetical protein